LEKPKITTIRAAGIKPNIKNMEKFEIYILNERTRVYELMGRRSLDRAKKFFENRICSGYIKDKSGNIVEKYSAWVVRESTAGYVIDRFWTKEEAEQAIKEYEKEDKESGYYEPGFYEPYNFELSYRTE
jgi:hypothetical protein